MPESNRPCQESPIHLVTQSLQDYRLLLCLKFNQPESGAIARRSWIAEPIALCFKTCNFDLLIFQMSLRF
jgi:hypothetical protein